MNKLNTAANCMLKHCFFSLFLTFQQHTVQFRSALAVGSRLYMELKHQESVQNRMANLTRIAADNHSKSCPTVNGYCRTDLTHLCTRLLRVNQLLIYYNSLISLHVHVCVQTGYFRYAFQICYALVPGYHMLQIDKSVTLLCVVLLKMIMSMYLYVLLVLVVNDVNIRRIMCLVLWSYDHSLSMWQIKVNFIVFYLNYQLSQQNIEHWDIR